MSRNLIARLTTPALFLFTLVAPVTVCFGQQDTRDSADQPVDHPCCVGTPESGPRLIVGVTACGGCHSKRAESSLPIDQAYKSTRIREHEATIWYIEDKHRQAYEVLGNDRSQQMARLLGIVDRQTNESLVHRDVRCLACHSSVPLAHLEFENNLLPAGIGEEPKFNLGVSCEACHGPAGTVSDRKGWISAHSTDSQSTKWNQLSPQEKFERYGFWDVRDTRTQAKICLSCHVGSVAQGKILTHEMFAAGHPPLPSFELNAFIEQQPRHWRFPDEKEPTVRDEYLALRGETYDPENLDRTKALLVSSLVALSEAMQLNADLIDADVTCPTDKPTWPELANFSCFACHHELKRDGWRQSRSLTPTPGRPTLHEWPTAMAEVTAEFLGQGDVFRQQLAELYAAMNQQPFGRPENVSAACRRLAGSADAWAVAVQQQHLKRGQDGQQLLDLIARKGIEQAYDYDSARQLIWAYERILHDVNTRPHEDTAASTSDENRPTWNGWLADRSPLTERESILKSLESALLLDLRLGKEEKGLIGNEQQPRPRVEVDLNLTLQKTATYDPQQIRAAFEQLSAAGDN